MEDRILLKVDHLKTFFKTKSGILPAVNGVSFTLKRGEILGVVGESGCGKSVMSMSILKLIEKYGGKVQEGSSVELEGRQVLDLPEKVMCDLRGKEISMISQDPMTSLNPVFTVEKQMVEMICRHTDMDKKKASAHALSWLKRVGILMVMYAGKAVEYGTKRQVFKEARHPYTQGLLASVPRLDRQEEKLYAIPGNVPNLTQKIEGCIFRDRCTKRVEKCAGEAPPQFLLDNGQRVRCWLYQEEAKEVWDE